MSNRQNRTGHFANGYKKFGKSKTDFLQKDEKKREKELEKYQECKITNIPLLRHVRYFVWDIEQQTYLYRKGGFIIDKLDEYVRLSNSPFLNNPDAFRWNVRLDVEGHPTKFHKLLLGDEKKLRDDLQDLSTKASTLISKKENKIHKLKKENAGLKYDIKFKS